MPEPSGRARRRGRRCSVPALLELLEELPVTCWPTGRRRPRHDGLASSGEVVLVDPTDLSVEEDLREAGLPDAGDRDLAALAEDVERLALLVGRGQRFSGAVMNSWSLTFGFSSSVTRLAERENDAVRVGDGSGEVAGLRT